MIRVGSELTDIQVVERILNDSYTIYYMDDGTVNMGSSFDIFDEVSHYDNPYISDEHRKNREHLKSVMESVGFIAYDLEWWHFRLRNDPYPSTYFDFDMYEPSGAVILCNPRIVSVPFIITIVGWLQWTDYLLK